MKLCKYCEKPYDDQILRTLTLFCSLECNILHNELIIDCNQIMRRVQITSLLLSKDLHWFKRYFEEIEYVNF